MHLNGLLVLILAGCAAAAAAASPQPVGLPDIIPLPLLLGPSQQRNPQLSPDGLSVAYLRPTEPHGAYNVFIKHLKPAAAASAAGRSAGGQQQTASSSSSSSSSSRLLPATAPSNEVSIFDLEGVENDLQVTFDERRGIREYGWSEDGKAILFIQDVSGDEVDHLFIVKLPSWPWPAAQVQPSRNSSSSSSSTTTTTTSSRPAQSAEAQQQQQQQQGARVAAPAAAAVQQRSGGVGAAIDLTPFPGVKASGIVSSKRFPGKLYIGLNRRQAEVFDMYSLNLSNGELTLDTLNPGNVRSWVVDYDFNIRAAMAYNRSDGTTYVIVRDDSSPSRPEGATASTAAAAAPLARPQRTYASLNALFTAAASPRFTYADWLAASTSGSDATAWRVLIKWPFGEEGGVFRFNKAGDALYIASSLDRDTAALQLIPTAPGGAQRVVTLWSHPLVNVGSVLFDPDTWEPKLASYDYLRPNWAMLGGNANATTSDWSDWDAVKMYRPGDAAAITDISSNKAAWLVLYSSDVTPSAYYLHTRGTWPPRLLFVVQPALVGAPLARMHPVVIPARDGLRLPAFLTLPRADGVPNSLPPAVVGVAPAGAAGLLLVNSSSGSGSSSSILAHSSSSSSSMPPEVAAGAPGWSGHWGPPPAAGSVGVVSAAAPRPLNLSLPLVLYVHGGPWARDYWGGDPVVQWLANRGYAVLQVNFRGSTGYGKAFLNAGNEQWGKGAMQHDLSDAVAWAVRSGIADPARVCIHGASYGGYATLAGLAFTPHLYACGIDLMGISDVGAFMRAIPKWWRPLRYEWVTRVGDAEGNATLNKAISPIYHIDRIQAPLMIGQGANDPRVRQAESDRIAGALSRRGAAVTYILYPDEGHGLVIPANRLDFYSRADAFLARVLGGRAEPLYKLPGSSALVVFNS